MYKIIIGNPPDVKVPIERTLILKSTEDSKLFSILYDIHNINGENYVIKLTKDSELFLEKDSYINGMNNIKEYDMKTDNELRNKMVELGIMTQILLEELQTETGDTNNEY